MKLPEIIYFKVTNEHFVDPTYYVAYSLESVKKAVRLRFDSQFECEFNEVPLSDIPSTAFVHSAEIG